MTTSAPVSMQAPQPRWLLPGNATRRPTPQKPLLIAVVDRYGVWQGARILNHGPYADLNAASNAMRSKDQEHTRLLNRIRRKIHLGKLYRLRNAVELQICVVNAFTDQRFACRREIQVPLSTRPRWLHE